MLPVSTRALTLQLVNNSAKLYDLKRAISPIMLPANYQVAACRIVAVISKVATPKLKLDTNSLPSLILLVDAPLGFTVWVTCLYCLHNEAKLVAYHPE